MLFLIVLAQDEVDKKGLSQKDVADNNQGIFLDFAFLNVTVKKYNEIVENARTLCCVYKHTAVYNVLPCRLDCFGCDSSFNII